MIELLIVMAILGVLVVVVLVAINPGERQSQARDTGRISAITQIGHSLLAYYSTNSMYPEVGTWAGDIVNSGEISSFPSGTAYSYNSVSACTTYVQPAVDGTYCYDEDQTNNNGAIVFAKAESTSHRSKCTSPEEAYFVFSTEDTRGGVICSSGDPVPWSSGSMTYQQ